MLREKNSVYEGVARTESFHHADLGATFEDGGGGSGGDAERGSDQRGERDDPQQRADAREDAAFRIGDAADGVDFGAGQHGSDLIADRGNVGRAEPAVVLGGSQLDFGVALRAFAFFGESVGGLSERADKKFAEFVRMIRQTLRDLQRDKNRFVLRVARGDDARHLQRRIDLVAVHDQRIDVRLPHVDRLPDFKPAGIRSRERCPNDAFALPVAKPRAINFPPRMRSARARLERGCHREPERRACTKCRRASRAFHW